MKNLLTHLLQNTKTQSNGCIVWLGYCGPNGYGQVKLNGKVRLVHRAYYEYFMNISLSRKTELHHICENKTCLNPEHLEKVSSSEHKNKHKKPLSLFCGRGHLYTPETTIIRANGCRECKICRKLFNKSKKYFNLKSHHGPIA